MEKRNIMRKNPNKVDFVKMFMAEAHGKCFYGTLKEDCDANGNPYAFSRIKINDGTIEACAENRKVLSKMLDEMCVMYLDKGIHKNAGKSVILEYPSYFTIPFSYEFNRMFLN